MNKSPGFPPLRLDPRTKLFLLLMGNICVFFAPGVKAELLVAAVIALLGFLCGAKSFTIKMSLVYLIVLLLQALVVLFAGGTLRTMLLAFAMLVRKVFPCGMLGGILIATTRVNEFMAAMNRIKMPKSVVIPLTVMLRYFPLIGEDWRAIKDAMKLRGVTPSLWGLVTKPALTVECTYVPLLMGASRVADELSAAAVARGIENPAPRSCLQPLGFRVADGVCAAVSLLVFAATLAAKGGWLPW